MKKFVVVSAWLNSQPKTEEADEDEDTGIFEYHSVYINSDYILKIYPVSGAATNYKYLSTIILKDTGRVIHVKETPEEILAQLK